MAPMRPGAAASLVPAAPLFCASSGFGAAERREPTNGSSEPAASWRNRERDRAACDKHWAPELFDSISLLPCLNSDGLGCLAVEPTADVFDRVLIEAAVKAAGDVADMRRCH